MKILRTLSLLLGALSCAAGLFAKDTNAAAKAKPLHNDHETLSYTPTALTREFSTGTGKVWVTWTWQGLDPATKNDVYECVIRQEQDPASDWGYSLYNLEIQGRLWKVLVSSATGSNVVFTSGPSANIAVGTNANGSLNAVIPAACNGNPPSPASHKPPVDKRIGFIKFTGTTCTLMLQSERVKHGPRTKSSHDATPPPPDGGGEN